MLSPGMVDGVGLGENQVLNRAKGVALGLKGLDDPGQGLRGVESGVVEEDNGPGLNPVQHPLGDLGGGEVLPVQRILIPYTWRRIKSSRK